MIKKTKTVVILIVICAVLIVVAFISNQWFAKQTIRTVNITGNNALSNTDINSIIDKQIMDVKNDGLNLNNIKNTLLSNEYIQNANVWINSKGVLGIDIEERIPIAVLINNTGTPNFIDKYGKVFSYNLYKEFINIPVVRNIEVNKNNTLKNKEIINLVSTLKNDYPILEAKVSEIKYNIDRKEYDFLMNFGDIVVNMGSTTDLENKLSSLQSFIDNVVLTSDDITKYKKLDARWKDKIVVN